MLLYNRRCKIIHIATHSGGQYDQRNHMMWSVRLPTLALFYRDSTTEQDISYNSCQVGARMANARRRLSMTPELPFKTPEPLLPVTKRIGKLFEQYSNFIDYHERIKKREDFRLTIDLKLKKKNVWQIGWCILGVSK